MGLQAGAGSPGFVNGFSWGIKYLVSVIFAQKSRLRRSASPYRLPTLSLILACGISAPRSQDFFDRAGTAEFQYVGNLIYARPAGMAGTYTSLAQGLDAVGYNPAGLSKSESARSISGTARYHFLDVSSGNVTYGFPGAGARTYAFSAAYINYGRIQGLDEDGKETPEEHMPVSFNPAFTAAGKVGDRIRLGTTVKMLSEYLGDFEGAQLGMGWGVDAGLLYQPNARNLGFGLALLNLGLLLQ